MKFSMFKMVVIVITLVIAILAYFANSQRVVMDEKRTQRTAMKNRIDAEIAEKYHGMVIDSELDGHCGIALYEIKILDGNKNKLELFYNIDTGEQVAGDVTENCEDLLRLIN